mgnify:FL=1
MRKAGKALRVGRTGRGRDATARRIDQDAADAVDAFCRYDAPGDAVKPGAAS